MAPFVPWASRKVVPEADPSLWRTSVRPFNFLDAPRGGALRPLRPTWYAHGGHVDILVFIYLTHKLECARFIA